MASRWRPSAERRCHWLPLPRSKRPVGVRTASTLVRGRPQQPAAGQRHTHLISGTAGAAGVGAWVGNRVWRLGKGHGRPAHGRLCACSAAVPHSCGPTTLLSHVRAAPKLSHVRAVPKLSHVRAVLDLRVAGRRRHPARPLETAVLARRCCQGRCRPHARRRGRPGTQPPHADPSWGRQQPPVGTGAVWWSWGGGARTGTSATRALVPYSGLR